MVLHKLTLLSLMRSILDAGTSLILWLFAYSLSSLISFISFIEVSFFSENESNVFCILFSEFYTKLFFNISSFKFFSFNSIFLFLSTPFSDLFSCLLNKSKEILLLDNSLFLLKSKLIWFSENSKFYSSSINKWSAFLPVFASF